MLYHEAGLPKTVDDAFASTLGKILQHGHVTEIRPGGNTVTELLSFQTGVAHPRARITRNPARPLNLTTAVARFVWMAGADQRLSDIAFYEPKVARYSDNGLTVPGSNYGMRIFQPRPGLDQVRGAIGRLRQSPGTRRAAAVVFQPEDAVRESVDIPCAFGTFFHIRDGALTTTVSMRSNNAYLLFPTNVFEFSLLGEIVATELGVELGAYLHWAAAIQVLDREYGAAVAAASAVPTGDAILMPPMPNTPAPLDQVVALAASEARVRTAWSDREAQASLDAAADVLDPYWLAFLRVLAIHRFRVSDAPALVERYRSMLPDWAGTSLEFGR